MSTDTNTGDTRPTVAVIGGGYAGYSTAKALDDFADVTLIEPRDAFVHNVAALRALVDTDWLPDIFLPYDHLLANGRVLRDRAVEVDAGRVVLASGTELTPEFVVLATGSTYPYPAKSGTDDTALAIGRYRQSHEELARADRILIAGAGPTGLELAGEISARWPEKKITILEPAREILAGPYKQELRDEVRRQLEERGVEFVLGERLTGEPESPPVTLGPFAVTTDKGRTIEADIWFRCNGLRARERLPERRPGGRQDGRRLDRGDPDPSGRRTDHRLRARRRLHRRPQDGRPRGATGPGRCRQHPGPARRPAARAVRALTPRDRDPARPRRRRVGAPGPGRDRRRRDHLEHQGKAHVPRHLP